MNGHLFCVLLLGEAVISSFAAPFDKHPDVCATCPDIYKTHQCLKEEHTETVDHGRPKIVVPNCNFNTLVGALAQFNCKVVEGCDTILCDTHIPDDVLNPAFTACQSVYPASHENETDDEDDQDKEDKDKEDGEKEDKEKEDKEKDTAVKDTEDETIGETKDETKDGKGATKGGSEDNTKGDTEDQTKGEKTTKDKSEDAAKKEK